ncbi:MAG: glucokinase [Gammaproteobacteria bacterium]|nr:MAG: glucokinase [Gammaproteobacteria bacterium]
MTATYPRLVADIGGTNARFAIERAPYELSDIAVLACADYDSPLSAVRAYLRDHRLTAPRHVAIAIATPITGDRVRMTNCRWDFSIAALKMALKAETLWVLNDFSAQALSITQMPADALDHLGGPERDNPAPTRRANCAVIGAGTGLGVAGLVPDGRGDMVTVGGEGGHVTFSPYDAFERGLLEFSSSEFGGHVSVERLLQGDGLTLMYRFLCAKQGVVAQRQTPAQVSTGALQDNDPIAIEVLSRYCAILGGFCGDVALTLGAVGGLYVSGGIVPRFVEFVRQSDFQQRFEDKGRFAGYLSAIPIYVVKHPQPGLLGAAVALQRHLNAETV